MALKELPHPERDPGLDPGEQSKDAQRLSSAPLSELLSLLRAAGLLIALAAVGGCGAVDPYATLARAPQPGQPSGQRVGICYNGLRSSTAQVQAEAQRECAADTLAQPVDTDWYMQMCPLLLPARATFVCTAKK